MMSTEKKKKNERVVKEILISVLANLIWVG